MCDEFDFLRSFLINNGFPLSFIISWIKKFLFKIFVPHSDVVSSRNKFYFTLPYFGAHSVKIKSELSTLLHEFFPDVDFHIILVNNFKIGSFFNFKDKHPLAMRSSLVYKFSCARCASGYVGSTIHALHTRVAEHAGRSFCTGSLITVHPDFNIRVVPPTTSRLTPRNAGLLDVVKIGPPIRTRVTPGNTFSDGNTIVG